MTAEEFLAAFAMEIGAEPPTQAQMDALLQVASIAAHGSERLAAPLACWIGGASGRSAEELLVAAQRILPGVE